MLYPFNKVNKIIIQRRLWDTRKNIEVEEKWVLRKEELVKETRENKIRLRTIFLRLCIISPHNY